VTRLGVYHRTAGRPRRAWKYPSEIDALFAEQRIDTIGRVRLNDPEARAPAIFQRILCGVDGTPESLFAVRQAVRLQEPDSELYLVSVAPIAKAAQAGFAATHAAESLQHEAETALAEARGVAPSAREKLVHGDPATALLSEAEAEQAALVAVGSHGHRRAAGMMLGTVAARTLRDARCSVLIARTARHPETWPQSIVVGIDGSVESAAAFSVARSLAERFEASMRTLAASDGLDREEAHTITSELQEQPGGAVDMLTAASDSADLVVLGNRGLHGLKAIGSVSERVAHRARASVLVVWPES
jgi:nucleotide-binding universal stress UspA family protein